MSKQLLAGVKVVELATFIAAGTAGRFMADLGADVVKVEPAKGDPLRYTAPSEGRPLDMYENTTWDLENANKRCISLNTKIETGREALFRLLETADVFITNWREPSLAKQGLDYEALKQRFPKLVYGIVTGFGATGPDRDLPGFDFTAFFARGGYLETLRQKGARPMNVVPGLGDHNVGMNLAAGVLAALLNAKSTGHGEKVETSLFETAVFNMGMMIQAAQYTDIGSKFPIDQRERGNPFLSAWMTSDDRYIQTCMPDYNTYFKTFLLAIGLTQYVDDDRYFPIQNLQKNKLYAELNDAVMERFSTKPVEHWKEVLTEADIPFAVAQSWEDLLEDRQAWENDCYFTMNYDNGNARTLVRPPVRFTEMGTPPYERGPFIGEHGPEVLGELGYSAEQIQTMQADGSLYVWDKKAAT